jgi:hypothetical protein
MRNNRNTLGDQWKPGNVNRSISNSIDRATINNPQNAVQIRQATQQQVNEKMANFIHHVLLKLPNQGNRASINNALLPKASTLISTMSSLMNGIDRNFDKTNLDV